jgi:hypothetical protein
VQPFHTLHQLLICSIYQITQITFFLLNRSIVALLFSLMYCLSCLPLSAQQAAPVAVLEAHELEPVLPFASPPAAKVAPAGAEYSGMKGQLLMRSQGKGTVTRIVSPGLVVNPVVIGAAPAKASMTISPHFVIGAKHGASLRAKASFAKAPPQASISLDVWPEPSSSSKGSGK